jgi:glutathione peroxidase
MMHSATLEDTMADLMTIQVKKIDGTQTTLSEFKGKVLLIVNVASECGLTPQYTGLENLHEKYADKGLAVLGFPANEFGAQEPGTNQQIHEFCKTKFGVKFPMFEKIVVKGAGIHPLYQTLIDQGPRVKTPAGSKLAAKADANPGKQDIHWNFEKFLTDMTPEDATLVKAIETELG